MRFIPNSVTRSMGRQTLKLKAQSPTILFGAGVVGMVGTAVLASRATLRLEGILDDIRADQADLEVVNASGHPEWSEADAKNAAIGILLKGGVRIVKLYGPSLLVGALSVAALTGSHRILNNRNAALGAAYAAVDRAFREYRARVVEDLGEQKDKEYRHGAEEREYIVETKTGPQPEMRTRAAQNAGTMYAQWFEPKNKNYRETRDMNLHFLTLMERYANERLERHGFVFLNDVYQDLGFERTKAGAMVGWTYDSPEDHISFGIFDGTSDYVDDFMMGNRSDILVDFNVDGIILDLIEDAKRKVQK